MLKSITPILVVDSIEEQLRFYEKLLGFSQAMNVPHEDKIGFVGLVRDGQMVMLQSKASLRDDLPAAAKLHDEKSGTLLYIEVDSLEAATSAFGSLPLLQPKRETFYGMREVWVRDSAGNILALAEKIV